MAPLYPPRDAALVEYRSEMRTLPTRLLLEQQEAYGWQLAEIETEFGVAWREETSSFLRFKLTEIERELERRQKLRGQTFTPAWPEGVTSDREYWRMVKEATDLQTLLERRVAGLQWRHDGRRLTTHCPFGTHRDSTPSFKVYPDQHFYCYGCRVGGNCFTFVMAYDGVPFLVAVETLAGEAGIVTPTPHKQIIVREGGEEQIL